MLVVFITLFVSGETLFLTLVLFGIEIYLSDACVYAFCQLPDYNIFDIFCLSYCT